MLPSHRLLSNEKCKNGVPNRGEELEGVQGVPTGQSSVDLGSSNPLQGISQSSSSSGHGFSPELPPNLADFLRAAGTGGLQNRNISTRAEDISNILRQKILLALEAIMEEHQSAKHGIILSLKDLHISSTSPSTVDIAIKCNVPKGKEEEVNVLLDTSYQKVMSILAEYISEHDPDYEKSQRIYGEKKKEFTDEVTKVCSKMLPGIYVEDIMTLKNERPIFSFKPLLQLDRKTIMMSISRLEEICMRYNTFAIFFTGEIETVRNKEKEEELLIQARRNRRIDQKRESKKQANITEESIS